MEIKEIINEEILSHNERQPVFRFTDFAENPRFYNYQAHSNNYDVAINEAQISVTWRVGFWLNDNGIENYSIDVQEVQGVYKVELRDKQSDELEQDNNRDIAEVPWKFNVIPAPLEKGGALYITSVDFDFETKICTVSFLAEPQQ